MTNIELFKFAEQHPEPIIDPYYNRDMVIIPYTDKEENELVKENTRLIELISVFSYLYKKGKREDDPSIKSILSEVCEILVNTKSINFSPFLQFFMVYNSSYSSFLKYSSYEKIKFLYNMLLLYIQQRHEMYMCHGYTNTILQVVCDNYSHKRKSKATIVKIGDMLKKNGFVYVKQLDALMKSKSFILPDKGDKNVFNAFKHKLNLELESAKTEQGKLPDMVFSSKGEYYIVEMKTMKGSGGGQDKQLTEIINFIRYNEKDKRLHYITYLDGEYSNLLHAKVKQPKIQRQYNDIMTCLQKSPENYFLNTASFEKFIMGLDT